MKQLKKYDAFGVKKPYSNKEKFENEYDNFLKPW